MKRWLAQQKESGLGTRDSRLETRDKSVFPLITSLYAREGAQGGNCKRQRKRRQWPNYCVIPMTLGTESKIDPPVVKDLLVRAVSSVLNHNVAVFVLLF